MPHSTGLRGRELIKGHATLNDFLMLVDPGCEVAISGADIVAVCDRHRGIGADGFVRVVRTTALPGGGAFAASVPEAEWFMDYYRADGTVAEMSGNAARLFAHVLDSEGLCPIADGESVTIGTRGGARTITRLGELWTVDMGPARLASPEEAEDEGWDTAVVVPGLDGSRAALSVEISGPHTVVALGEEGELEAAAFAGLTDSADPVAYDPAPEVGTNLELVVPLGACPGARRGGVPLLRSGVLRRRSRPARLDRSGRSRGLPTARSRRRDRGPRGRRPPGRGRQRAADRPGHDHRADHRRLWPLSPPAIRTATGRRTDATSEKRNRPPL